VVTGARYRRDALDARANTTRVLQSLARAGLAWVDVSTGRFLVCELKTATSRASSRDRAGGIVVLDVARRTRAECSARSTTERVDRSEREEWRFERDAALRALRRHFKVATLEASASRRLARRSAPAR